MRHSNAEQLGSIISQLIRQEGLETPLNQYRLIESWKEVMGEGIARYTGNLFIKNQTLFVQIKSSVLRQDLSMSRGNLVKRLNEHVKAQVITDITFY
ncbi:MAG: DUF721 domain-containing protein [Prevotellaceae bacterium]|nr:DUF721 domain-containing protein [Prevotellaceae bacterium]